jgi:hypothetical protein
MSNYQKIYNISINESEFKKIFLENCEYTGDIDKNFKVLYKKIDNLVLVLFGVDVVNIKKKKYLPYIYYLGNDDEVKFKQIKKKFFGLVFNLENKTFEKISKIKLGNDSYTSLLLNSLTDLLNITNTKNNTLKLELENLKQKLENKIRQPQLQQQAQLQLQQQAQPQIQPQIPLTQKKQLNQLQQQQEILSQIQQEIQKQNEQQIQEKTPQMQLQLKINEFNERLQRIKNTKSNNLEEKKANLERNILNELKKIESNPENKNIQKQIKNLQKLQNELKDFQELIKRNNNNLKKPVNVQNYICKYPGLEVKFESIDEIFFGYNISLFVKSQNDENNLYYKYSYHDSKFYELKKQGEDLEEEEINIESIPTYDILCLYEIIKDKQNDKSLTDKLIDRINKAKENISNTEQKFSLLTNSNFNKEKKNSQNKTNKKNITTSSYKNFGKVKKRRGTDKTYIFFGAKELTENKNNKSSYQYFSYVCFEDKNDVFYYVKNKKNEKKQLFDFPYIYPLEDLISFILLRRIITNDTNFANKIYEEAKKRIKFLKTKEFQDKIRKNKNLNNFKVTPQELNLSKNSSSVNFNIYKKNSILPISPYGITDT